MKNKTLIARLSGVALLTISMLTTSVDVQAQNNKYHVNSETGKDSNSGAKWDTAFQTLQAALKAADKSGDTIFIAKGTYYGLNYMTTKGIFEIMFNDLKIYGSFIGNESSLDDRVIGTNAGDTTILDGKNRRRVLYTSALSNATIIDGVKIINGRDAFGSGMLNFVSSSPTLKNVTISGNTSERGGGGMFNFHNSSPILMNVTICGNTAGSGGGIINSENCSPVMMNVTISGNTATVEGGGIYNSISSPIMTNVIICGNTASDKGGGMYNSGTSSPVLMNVTISGNTASGGGGGMYNNTSSSPIFGSVVLGTPTLYNCIVLGNNANKAGTEGFGGNAPTYTDCLVQEEGYGSSGNMSDTYDAADIFVDFVQAETGSPDSAGAPTTSGNFRLKAGSFAINMGKNAHWTTTNIFSESTQTLLDSLISINVLPSGTTLADMTDLDGMARVDDINGIGVIDLGAYEYPASATGFHVNEINNNDYNSYAWTKTIQAFFIALNQDLPLAMKIMAAKR